MAKLVIGILIGLVLGLYLDSAAGTSGAQPFTQIEVAVKNLVQF